MEEHREKGNSRRLNERRADHRRVEHRRKANQPVDEDRRQTLDQRSGYQRKQNRRTGAERRI